MRAGILWASLLVLTACQARRVGPPPERSAQETVADLSDRATGSDVPQPEEASPGSWSQELAAIEYADMVRHGTLTERAWAATARDRASLESRKAMDAALERPELPSAAGPATGPKEGTPGSPLAIDLHIYDYEPWPAMHSSWPPEPLWEREDIQSAAQILSPSQLDSLFRGMARYPVRYSLVHRRTLKVRSGEATRHFLPDDCVLRLHLSGSEDLRVVAGVRYRAARGIVFAPTVTTSMRRTESLLIGPEDTLAPAPGATRARFFLLTVQGAPSSAALNEVGRAR